MRAPRLLLIGTSGQVGWELRRTLSPLGEVHGVDYPVLDLTDAAAVRKYVRDFSPNVVLNAAAYTAVDKAESDSERCLQINGTAPRILAEEAKKVGALLVHYSTDYVFDGTKTKPYTEEDLPNPLSAYGRSKLAGDRAIQQVDCPYLIFRLCWVYGARGQNFMLTMMRLAKEREKLKVVNDQLGCPTWSRMIAEATALSLKHALAAQDLSAYKGVYNLAASGQTSWHGFAQGIIEAMPHEEKRCQAVEAIPTTEYPLPAKRPAYSVLSCEKLQRTFGLRLPDWAEGLKQVLGKE